MNYSQEIAAIGKKMDCKFKEMMESSKVKDNLKEAGDGRRKLDEDDENTREKQIEYVRKVWNQVCPKKSRQKDENGRPDPSLFSPIEEESDAEFQKGLVEIFTNSKFSQLESIMGMYNNQTTQNSYEVIPEQKYADESLKKTETLKDIHQEEIYTSRNQCIRLKLPRTSTNSQATEDTKRSFVSTPSMDTFSLYTNSAKQTSKQKNVTGKKNNKCIKLNIPKYSLQMEIFLKSSRGKEPNNSVDNNDEESDDTIESEAHNFTQNKEMVETNDKHITVDKQTTIHSKLTDEKKMNARSIYVESHPKQIDNEDNMETKTTGDVRHTSHTETYRERMKVYIESVRNIAQEVETKLASLNQTLAQMKRISEQ